MTPTARASPKAVSGNQKLHHAMGHDLGLVWVRVVFGTGAGAGADTMFKSLRQSAIERPLRLASWT